jgi:hypothetical protein
MCFRSINDNSGRIIDESTVMVQLVASLVTYDLALSLTIVIYSWNVFIVQATGINFFPFVIDKKYTSIKMVKLLFSCNNLGTC